MKNEADSEDENANDSSSYDNESDDEDLTTDTVIFKC